MLAHNAEHWLSGHLNAYLRDDDEYRAITRQTIIRGLAGTITWTPAAITVTLGRPAPPHRPRPQPADRGDQRHPARDARRHPPHHLETLAVEPGTCGGCGADLAGAPGRVASSMQVLDIPPAALTVTEYQMMRRTCGCGQVTTAAPPPGVTGGPVCYGPGVVDAATLLASTDVIGIERAADLMGALLGAPVSTGFVSRCLVRLDAALIAAGFEGALKDALRAADMLGTDEIPPRSPRRPPARKAAATRTSTRCGPCALTPAAGRT